MPTKVALLTAHLLSARTARKVIATDATDIQLLMNGSYGKLSLVARLIRLQRFLQTQRLRFARRCKLSRHAKKAFFGDTLASTASQSRSARLAWT
jgi:hypothetical protein